MITTVTMYKWDNTDHFAAECEGMIYLLVVWIDFQFGVNAVKSVSVHERDLAMCTWLHVYHVCSSTVLWILTFGLSLHSYILDGIPNLLVYMLPLIPSPLPALSYLWLG